MNLLQSDIQFIPEKSHSTMEVPKECMPLNSNKELFEFKDVFWRDMVNPLEERAAPRFLGEDFGVISFGERALASISEESRNRRKVLICHDMMNNYRNDRFINGQTEFHADYRFYSWSGVDYFCYFSHHYISIPPQMWINAAHKNGVKVLGELVLITVSLNSLIKTF